MVSIIVQAYTNYALLFYAIISLIPEREKKDNFELHFFSRCLVSPFLLKFEGKNKYKDTSMPKAMITFDLMHKLIKGITVYCNTLWHVDNL